MTAGVFQERRSAPDREAPTQRVAVPWSTVVPLAVVLCYADGFWATSLRGAVGAVGHAQGPFSRWWHESTVLLPLFAMAVLAALMLARRGTGAGGARAGGRTTAAAAVLVALAGTLTGIAVLAGNAAYDYHLQSEQIRMMAAMGSSCQGACLAGQQHATLLVHVHSVIYVSGWIVLTNLALVAWMVPVLGGRLPLVRWVGSGVGRSRAAGLRLLLAAGLLGAGGIHAAVVSEHLAEWPAAGYFFIALTVGEVAVAGAVALRPARRALVLAIALSLGPLLVWTYSRAFGLPIGPEPGVTEAVGIPDVLAGVLELVTAGLALRLLRLPQRLPRPAGSPPAYALAALALLSVTAIGLAATGSVGFDLFDAPAMHMTAVSTP